MCVSNLCSSISPAVNTCSGPWELALAISARGLTLYLGLPILSTYIAFVFSSMAASNAALSSEVTNLILMPNFLNSTKSQSISVNISQYRQSRRLDLECDIKFIPLNSLYVCSRNKIR